MSDESPVVNEAPVADVTTPTTPPEATTEEPTTERVYTAADYRAVVNEAKNLRSRLRETEATATTVKSELDTLRSQLSAHAEELRSHRLRAALNAAAKDEAFDVELVSKLVEVEWSDDGKPKGVQAAVKSLLEQYPQLRTAPQAPRIPTQSPGGSAPAANANQKVLDEKRNSGMYHPL